MRVHNISEGFHVLHYYFASKNYEAFLRSKHEPAFYHSMTHIVEL